MRSQAWVVCCVDLQVGGVDGLAQDVAGHAGVEARVLGVHTLDLVTVRVARVRAFPQQYNSFWNSTSQEFPSSKFQLH